jgi:Type II secretory pathway, component ExeA (predicted ATPase)
MSALQLKKMLKALRVPQAELARECGVSPATIAQMLNHGQWPSDPLRGELQRNIKSFLASKKMLPGVIAAAFEVDAANEVEPESGNSLAPDHKDQSQEDVDMLLRKQTLSPEAKKLFGLVRNPFTDLQSDEDMWINPDIRYVREHMYATAKHSGITAVVGESGAGKTSVRKALKDRIAQENLPIIIAEPYMLASEDSEKKGKTVKSTHIAEAILRAAAPLEKPRMSADARFYQLHRVLKDAHKSGQRVCVIIDEAHSLSIPTLKHLKRIYELEPDGGYGNLISIILIGQPELLMKLNERNPEIRELVQRCEVVTLSPIPVADLEGFIDFRLSRIGKRAADIIDATGITALADKMVSRDGASQLYPLAVGNFVVAALNLAAKIGVPAIDADIVKEVV